MSENHMDQLREIYEGYEVKGALKLYYFTAHSRFFTPEEREQIQNQVFDFLKSKKIGYVHVAWGYALFISDQDLQEIIEVLVGDDRFVITSLEINGDLDKAVSSIDEKLHDIVEGLSGR